MEDRRQRKQTARRRRATGSQIRNVPYDRHHRSWVYTGGMWAPPTRCRPRRGQVLFDAGGQFRLREWYYPQLLARLSLSFIFIVHDDDGSCSSPVSRGGWYHRFPVRAAVRRRLP